MSTYRDEESKLPLITRLILIFAGIIVSFFLVRIFFTVFIVTDNSMEPNYHSGDYVYLLKHTTPKSGDAVLIEYPANSDSAILRRIAAISGDRVSVAMGKLMVNGKPADIFWKTKQNERDPLPSEMSGRDTMAEVLVPDGSYFVITDNLDIASDSRDMGPVHRERIIGRVIAHW